MGDPVSRVAQCYAEGPESPKSDACKAAVAAGGTQALYDWNGIRIGNADGQHQALIPDGKLCSANNDEFKGLDLARADWPATGVSSGSYTFKYRVTAPHKGTFKVYVTKPGYDPAQPLAWDDLDLANPVATATDPAAVRRLLHLLRHPAAALRQAAAVRDLAALGQPGGVLLLLGRVVRRQQQRQQRQRYDDRLVPCLDRPAPTASAPSEEQIEDGSDKSTIEHQGPR